MKANTTVIAGLRAALPMEVCCQLQYQTDAAKLKSDGLNSLAKVLSRFSDDCEHFAKKLTRRLLLFQEDIGYSIEDDITEASSLTELLSSQLAAENDIIPFYEQQVEVARAALDDTTRNLYEHLLKWHQEGRPGGQGHVAWLERQLRLITRLGESGYISVQATKSDKE